MKIRAEIKYGHLDIIDETRFYRIVVLSSYFYGEFFLDVDGQA